MACRRRIYLDPEAVERRADEFPAIKALLGDRVGDVLDGKRRRADAAPLMLRLLERSGEGSRGMLALFSEGITHFDQVDPPGWSKWRASLAALDRIGLLSRYFELLAAMWFETAGFEVREFEPEGRPGTRTDLLVAYQDEELLVEATSPGPHRSDWIEDAMEHLTLALSRVESGLVIEVDGYESLSLDSSGSWKETALVATQQQEAVVNSFAREAEKLDHSELPQVVITPGDDQPLTITAISHHPESTHHTVVCARWSRSGLVPHVDRLAEKILHERKHLPDEGASSILVDLSRWPDFRNADYYQREVARKIAGRLGPVELVGTCVGTHIDSRHGLIERGTLAADQTWTQTALGQHFTTLWAGASHTP